MPTGLGVLSKKISMLFQLRKDLYRWRFSYQPRINSLKLLTQVGGFLKMNSRLTRICLKQETPKRSFLQLQWVQEVEVDQAEQPEAVTEQSLGAEVVLEEAVVVVAVEAAQPTIMVIFQVLKGLEQMAQTKTPGRNWFII